MLIGQEKWDELLKNSEKTLLLAQELKDERGISTSYERMGYAYLNKKVPKALEYFQKSLKIGQKLDDKYVIMNQHEGIAHYYLSIKDFKIVRFIYFIFLQNKHTDLKLLQTYVIQFITKNNGTLIKFNATKPLYKSFFMYICKIFFYKKSIFVFKIEHFFYKNEHFFLKIEKEKKCKSMYKSMLKKVVLNLSFKTLCLKKYSKR